MTEFVTTAKRSNWSARFSPDDCKLWRTLQTELTHRGATDRAKELEEQIRGLLGIVYGCDLPERNYTLLHTRRGRSGLICSRCWTPTKACRSDRSPRRSELREHKCDVAWGRRPHQTG